MPVIWGNYRKHWCGLMEMLCNSGGIALATISKHVENMESNEAEVLAILEAV